MSDVERRLAAILSADVAGYSRLMAEDEAATIRTLTDYREEVGMLVRQHRGRVVDFTGDNFLAEFPTALDATHCAVEIQRVLAARNVDLPADRRMQFRIGIHLGDVTVQGERLYGDGVNIAARLEGLAEPGGVCLSATVYEQVAKKLTVEVDDLGTHTLKNIPRPVHAYRVRWKLERFAAGADLPGMKELTVPGFGGRPAIAVLPFDNLSGDPEQEYFADGIAEDLLTRLSLSRDFPVIARNSSFVYKGKAVDVKQVSRELGVRYVVEGSVRKAGTRLRISTQLIDATTGEHVWAERYDRELRDLFTLQDEITEAIVGALSPALWRSEETRAARKESHRLDAWDSVARGWWHFQRQTKDDSAKARLFFEHAIELDPHHADGYVGVGATHWLDTISQWTDSLPGSIAALEQAAQRALRVDDREPRAHVLVSRVRMLQGEGAEAIACCSRAIELNPSLALAHSWLGLLLAITGRAEEGIAAIEKAIRLSPEDWALHIYLSHLALAHFVAGRYREAVEWAKRSVQRRSDLALAHTYLAASYAHLGQLEKAHRACTEALRLWPDLSLTGLQLNFACGHPEFIARYFDGLRQAGMKE